MRDEAAVKRRPGGRTARTKARTFAAVAALVAAKGHAAVTMTEVAERAGVAVTSLYRRWGDVQALIMEVAVDQLMREKPLPDTGSLSGDLQAWARAIAEGLQRPEGSSFFRAVIATAAMGPPSPARGAALQKRREQVVDLIARARDRGEQPPSDADILDHLLAPLYMRALFGMPATPAQAQRLVDRLLGRPEG